MEQRVRIITDLTGVYQRLAWKNFDWAGFRAQIPFFMRALEGRLTDREINSLPIHAQRAKPSPFNPEPATQLISAFTDAAKKQGIDCTVLQPAFPSQNRVYSSLDLSSQSDEAIKGPALEALFTQALVGDLLMGMTAHASQFEAMAVIPNTGLPECDFVVSFDHPSFRRL